MDGGVVAAGRLLRRDVDRAGRRHALLMAALMLPSVILVAFCFVLPLALFLFRGVDNAEVPRHLPRTAAALAAWDGAGIPPEQVHAALVADLREIGDTPQLAQLGRRLNHTMPGFRGMLSRTARRLPPPTTTMPRRWRGSTRNGARTPPGRCCASNPDN